MYIYRRSIIILQIDMGNVDHKMTRCANKPGVTMGRNPTNKKKFTIPSYDLGYVTKPAH